MSIISFETDVSSAEGDSLLLDQSTPPSSLAEELPIIFGKVKELIRTAIRQAESLYGLSLKLIRYQFAKRNRDTVPFLSDLLIAIKKFATAKAVTSRAKKVPAGEYKLEVELALELYYKNVDEVYVLLLLKYKLPLISL